MAVRDPNCRPLSTSSRTHLFEEADPYDISMIPAPVIPTTWAQPSQSCRARGSPAPPHLELGGNAQKALTTDAR